MRFATLRLSALLLSLLLSLLTIAGCSTGIENTRTIKMTRAEKKEVRPGAEELLVADLRSQRLRDWQPGKRFLIADDKASLLLEFVASKPGDVVPMSLKGRTVRFRGFSACPNPGGSSVAVIEFQDSCGTLIFNTEKSEERVGDLTGLDLPMMIDLELVENANALLKGRRLWTLTSLWYDDDLVKYKGEQFVPVTVLEVVPGDMVFPLLVKFIDDKGRYGSSFMNVVSAKGPGAESRTFPAIFSLSDPKLKYPSISEEAWKLICREEVALGMTKEECRLSLGNPSDVNAGHNWSSVIDVWGYKDGTFLQFQDGLLVNFRH